MATRVREVNSKDDMQRVIDDFITTGYVVKEQGINTTMLQKHTWGSAIGWIVAIILAFILAIPTVFISLAAVPIAYLIIAHYTAPKVLLKLAGETGSVAPIVAE